jgi:K+-transporting ATPase ATPase C chain
MTVITGVIYPLVMTVAAQVIFPAQANGSLVTVNDTLVGSSLVGQMNNDPRYFWPRPSAISYNPLPSSGSNLGPASTTLQEMVTQREADFRTANHLADDVVLPPEMVFASASGLDPHISPEAARLQIERVAEARGLAAENVAALVEQYVEQPQLGILGQPRVNVLLLNLALDRLQ